MFSTLSKTEIIISVTFVVCKCFQFGLVQNFVVWEWVKLLIPEVFIFHQEKDHQLRVEDLQGEITHRERHITNLKEDSSKLQVTINHLNKEIDFKRQEIQKVKSDTANQIR